MDCNYLRQYQRLDMILDEFVGIEQIVPNINWRLHHQKCGLNRKKTHEIKLISGCSSSKLVHLILEAMNISIPWNIAGHPQLTSVLGPLDQVSFLHQRNLLPGHIPFNCYGNP